MLVAPLLAHSVPLPPAGELRFEVASIKPNEPNAGDPVRVEQRFLPGRRFEAVNVTLGSVIRRAYGLQDFQMAGMPEWLHTDRFDIQTRGPAGAVDSKTARRLQSLLAERFALKAHRETRNHPMIAELVSELPTYAGRMVIDRTGLIGGFDLEIRFDASRPIPGAGARGGFPLPAQPAGGGDPDAPSLFTALEEQLGLKLEAQTGPVEALVIDHVEHPKPN